MLRASIPKTLALSCLGAFSVAAAQEDGQADCQLAERYYALAQDRLVAYEDAEAALYLERAGIACPRYAFFQELGELRMTSLDEDERRLAVEAFIESHALASSDQERARALWKYAALLDQEGDPQNADRLIRAARRLDGGNEEIAALAERIQEQIENPTREQLVRGLADSLYKPLMMAAAAGGSSSALPADRTTVAEGPSIRIPIHFEFNSVRVDAETEKNIEVLAQALLDERFQGRRFEFVGHADVRGDARRNMELSRQRALAVHAAVTEIEPGLEGRISVTGRGEEEPLEPGDTEEAHRANRRLQVLVE